MIRAMKNTGSVIGRTTSIVSTIRETQSLCAYIKPEKKPKNDLKGSQVNDNESISEDGEE
jgi:hypothetical protein